MFLVFASPSFRLACVLLFRLTLLLFFFLPHSIIHLNIPIRFPRHKQINHVPDVLIVYRFIDSILSSCRCVASCLSFSCSPFSSHTPRNRWHTKRAKSMKWNGEWKLQTVNNYVCLRSFPILLHLLAWGGADFLYIGSGWLDILTFILWALNSNVFGRYLVLRVNWKTKKHKSEDNKQKRYRLGKNWCIKGPKGKAGQQMTWWPNEAYETFPSRQKTKGIELKHRETFRGVCSEMEWHWLLLLLMIVMIK